LWAAQKVPHEKDVVRLKDELDIPPKDHVAHIKCIEPPEAPRAHIVGRLDLDQRGVRTDAAEGRFKYVGVYRAVVINEYFPSV